MISKICKWSEIMNPRFGATKFCKQLKLIHIHDFYVFRLFNEPHATKLFKSFQFFFLKQQKIAIENNYTPFLKSA